MSRGAIRRSVALLAALTLFASLPAHAYHNPNEPVIARGGELGNGWVALTFQSDGSPVSSEVLGFFGKLRPAVFASYIYRGDGAFGGGVVAAFGDSGSRGTKILVDANVADQNVHHEVYDEYDSNSYGGQSIGMPDPDGVFTILHVASADVAHWTWTFEGGGGASLLAVATGDRAIRYVDRDFRGIANVQAWADEGVGGHVVVDASASFEVKDTWVGGYFAAPGPHSYPNLLTLSTPSGDQVCFLRCTYDHLVGPDRAGPGTYTARLTGAGMSNAYVWGAEAHLPQRDTLLTFTGESSAWVEPGSSVSLSARLVDETDSAIAEAPVDLLLHGPDGPVAITAVADGEGLVQGTITAPSEPGCSGWGVGSGQPNTCFYLVTASYGGEPDGPGAASASYILEVAAD